MATATPEDQPRSQPSVELTRSYDNKTEAPLGHSHDAAPGPTAPVDSEKGTGSADGDDDKAEEGDYATGLKLFILMTSLLLCQFLVALDMSIIATAIPKITREFQSLDQVGWYGSGFLLTLAGFVSLWGKAFKHASIKWVFLSAVVVFELGSLICGVAQNSTTLIVGRAIQGFGGAGMTSGVYLIVSVSVVQKLVPAFLGLLSGIFSVASVVGPLLGGAFTDRLTWRWCFYINLIVGAPSILFLAFFYKPPAHHKIEPIGWKDFIYTLDLPGVAVVLGGLTCFILAIEYGGVTKAWNSGTVIGLLVAFGVLVIVFIVLEWYQGDRALLVGRLMKRRTIAACAVFVSMINFSFFPLAYNLPIYFQAVNGVSPLQSGIRLLPTILPMTLFSLFSAPGIVLVGWYQPWLMTGASLAAIGAGLIYMLDIDSTSAQWIGFQFVAGVGTGLAMQPPVIIANAITPKQDNSMAMSDVLFFQFIGGTFGIGMAQAIFNNGLISSLPELAPMVSPAEVLSIGAYDLKNVLSGDALTGVLRAYMRGLHNAWAMSIAGAAVAVFLPLLGAYMKLPKTPPKSWDEKPTTDKADARS
ncbi:major facilitator superfamily transporter [Colletotrichum abscissum]|uniref:Major facilitator superfamily transporter n=1 Tax=Colletotrichum abscissum TaxID=1671311 RepID=A0A9P9XJM3_9PEZI|nr:major facilitator superfamily transporter [Colletotrichum abscissum]KAI3555014.1 major facilitator superfamily transporter [Colletotrichum abscissum]KAK1493408.1 major facilitator superfamily transporter [Colletotrichum abscissum]